MKHSATKILFSYWDELRGERSSPERSEIDPGAIRHILADTFICEVDEAANHPFRLAGTRVCALFGKEVKGLGFAALWGLNGAGTGVFEARSLVSSVLDETSGVVAGLQGLTRSGQDIEIELLLLPLRHAGRTHARLLGSISSVSPAPWIGLDPVIQMTLRSVRIIRGGEAQPPAPLLRAAPPASSPAQPERRGSFMVYAGGKQSPNIEDQHSN
jgi:hypothetical protein